MTIVLAILYPARFYVVYGTTNATLLFALGFGIFVGYCYLVINSLWSIITKKTTVTLKYITGSLLTFSKSYISAMLYIFIINVLQLLLAKYGEVYVGIQWPEVDPADIERLVIEKVNAYRIVQGDVATTMLPGLTEVARYRANQLTTNFEHRVEQHVSTELKYGQYIDLAPYGMPDDSYYKGYSREAIGMGDWFGTAKSMSDRIADGFHHSKGHWSYVGSSKYPYIAVGIAKATGKWYVCVLMSDDNYGG